MGKPVTLLEELCGRAMSFGAQLFETERKDGRQRAFAQIDGARTRIANFEDSSSEAKELRANLYAAAKKSIRTAIGGKAYILHVGVLESLGEDGFEVNIDPAPKLDPWHRDSPQNKVRIWPSSIMKSPAQGVALCP